MKKILALLLVFILSLSITGCGSDDHEYDPSEGNVLITEAMIENIRDEVIDPFDPSELSYTYKSDALWGANNRVEHMSGGYEDIKEFYDIKISSEGYKDDWHYCFYGTIYGKSKYNKNLSYDFYLQIRCKEDSSKAEGYDVQKDGIGIDI